ncbi:FeoA family protein [Wolinella succinogenes]|jgi:ferrous iron transport protein A|uniref:Ferrous iron transporter FeoA-like domain-containing protein n=1 Tax=Wolinella succinogenes (strain ATCC 29543 / DSM 1740 / CCUG 13145 / JCM 31913 / LMG 7466 / NCTC 11488 / FDC 602W) TaxID=273121 RepID=Q7MRX9_WOLSU|nr:FeoA family protein [Wolinella succinogenes]NLU33340.1 ferrous iron transport protein A [Wolinella succinogenes]CAE10058.1 hypothetical protein WS0955 [Wolinella succinogenes]VEG82269.1 FeoA domain [Wolinella succinogenes]HCZ19546.1 ferrous iron transport protein A [Helicobacter sp.]
MKLHELQKGEKAVVKGLPSDQILRERLHSFGIFKESHLEVKEVSLVKATLVVALNQSLMILRSSEAESIEVEKLVS